MFLFHQSRFIWHKDQRKRVGATPDAFFVDGESNERGVLEVKCPFRRQYLDYIPPEYMAQMQ